MWMAATGKYAISQLPWGRREPDANPGSRRRFHACLRYFLVPSCRKYNHTEPAIWLGSDPDARAGLTLELELPPLKSI